MGATLTAITAVARGCQFFLSMRMRRERSKDCWSAFGTRGIQRSHAERKNSLDRFGPNLSCPITDILYTEALKRGKLSICGLLNLPGKTECSSLGPLTSYSGPCLHR